MTASVQVAWKFLVQSLLDLDKIGINIDISQYYRMSNAYLWIWDLDYEAPGKDGSSVSSKSSST